MPLQSSAIRVRSYSTPGSISLSEIISALSFALDLTEGAVPGHALRTCLLGMRIAAAAGVPHDEISSLYYGLLLKDAGCSSTAALMSQIAEGHTVSPKADSSAPGASLAHAQPLLRIHLPNTAGLTTLRCERGAGIVRKLGLGRLASNTVLHLDECWDGTGYPQHLRRDEIPLLARIGSIAQHLDVFGTLYGPERAIQTLEDLSGSTFDPALVRIALALHSSRTLWNQCGSGDRISETRRAVLDLDPVNGQRLESLRIDEICQAFADVVDAKSNFTYRHSIDVAKIARAISEALDLQPARIQLVHRAALLHDIGKLHVPTHILDKPEGLTPQERALVQEHPGLSRRILQRIDAFRELAVIAGQHHERLDGSGYPYRLTADDLSIEARIVAVADVFGALHEERPYRPAMRRERIIDILRTKAPQQLDPDCVEALISVTA
jgi:putative nucleotidyltransferase with HDIG domain